MILAYISITGNVKDFVEKTGFKSVEINPANPFISVNENFIVVVPSYEGAINEEVEDFIEYKNNKEHLVGFASSGNLNFDELFCINAKELSAIFNKPIIFKFEFSGTNKDIENFKKEVDLIEKTYSTK